LADGEVLVEIAASGICGSDLHVFAGAPAYDWTRIPVTLGHEFAGTVVDTGGGSDLAVGTRVVGMSIQGCLTCPVCASGHTNLCEFRRVIGYSYNGGMADRVAVDRRFLLPVPPELSLLEAAVAEPLAVAIHACGRASLTPNADVGVLGPGPLGLLIALYATSIGCRTELVGLPRDEPNRLLQARNLGIRAISSDSVDRLATADVWFDATGSPAAIAAALGSVRRHGAVVLSGTYVHDGAVSFFDAARREVSIHSSYASVRSDYETALHWLVDHRSVSEAIVTPFALSDWRAGFQAAREGDVVKALLVP
jgi:threonine dehydrogenase-like Zn-dependent dehydrogenase